MNTHADKTQENKRQAVANSLPKQQISNESAFQFVDNRPEAIAQKKLQEAINNSPQVQQLRAYQEMANNSPHVKQLRAHQAMSNSFTSQTAQRKENLEEETLQGKFAPIQKKENNTGLPDNLKSGVENLSGYSMDDVKVHFNSDKPAQLQAYAYAQGTDIHLASGQEKHLPHEAWHVVQQKQGRVKPTMQMKGKVNINDDVGLEKEADVMGTKSFQIIENRFNTFSQERNIHNLNSSSKNQHSPQVPSTLNTIVQRNWDSSGKEPIYKDVVNEVEWHLCSDGELWYTTDQEASPYAGYAGIKNKGSYAKWFMLRNAPFELIKKQAESIEIPKSNDLKPEFHKAYQLYVYIIGISNLKWSDIVVKPPFSSLGWRKVEAVYQHYKKHVNPLVEKEDGGLNDYYGSFYKIMNPFLRALRAEFGDKRYDEIVAGNIGSDSAKLVEILQKKYKEAKIDSEIGEGILKEVLAQIRGAKKEIKKKSEIIPIDNSKIPTVYRGDFSGLVGIMAKECGFEKDLDLLDQNGTLVVNKDWTQFQFVSTTTNKAIGAPAETGTIWNIALGSNSFGTLGGLYSGEQEVLFAPKTSFYIEKIVTAKEYDNSGPTRNDNTKYIVFARQG